MGERNALVFGASGITGWGTLQALSKDASFASVTGTSVRKLDVDLPRDGRLTVVSGVDLSKDLESIRNVLKGVGGIENITHVYYTALLPHPDVEQKVALNVKIFETAITLVDELCPRLEFVLLLTGSMYYGLEYATEIPYDPPFAESRSRIPAPFYDKIFYYPQLDWISAYAKGKKWRWADSRPDLISGFVPTGGFMNFIGFLGIYLATYRNVHGAGASVKFPGSEAGWKTKFTDCNQNTLGRFNVWISTCEKEEVNDQSFNIANGDITSWSYLFPKIAKWFDLEAVAPTSTEDGGAEAVTWWQETGSKAYSEMVKTNGLKAMQMGDWQWGFLRACTTFFFLDRQLDLSKVRALGWKETVDSAKGYLDALDQYASYGIIPTQKK